MSQAITEAERIRYLDAMGVVSYIPRIELPGAKPSVLCDASGCEELPPVIDSSNATPKSGRDTLQQLQAGLAPVRPAPRVVPGPAPRVTSATPKAPAAMAVHFHWVVLQPAPSLLLLAPAAHLGQAQLELLKNILTAIQVTAPVFSTQEQVSWPPDRKLVGTSSFTIEDAREMLRALLQGWQKRFGELRHVLVFDPHLGKTLFGEMSVPGLGLRVLPSLHEMTTSPPEKIAEAKKTTWQLLKDLKPA